MTFSIEPLIDAGGTKYWILFEHGLFHDPTAVITDSEMRNIARAVIGTEPTIEDLGHELKLYRKRNRRSQAEIAEMAGISRNYISQIERGKAKNLSLDMVNRLRKVVGK
jgi:DNA-binding XRE family transcriptional regulator